MAKRARSSRRAGAPEITLGVAVAAILLVGALFLVAMRVTQTAPVGDDVASAAGRVATAPARAGETLLGRLAGMWTATERVAELEAENRDLLAWKDLAERLAERNARYEALLRLPPDHFGAGADMDEAIAAQLVLDSGGPFTRTLVANAGTDHGVQVGYFAVNEHGLIGRVVSVGRRSSRIMMLDDYNSRIPVMGATSRVRAVLAGQATQPPDLLTRPFSVDQPRLDFIVGAASLREGERIITSGDGGLFPRGLPVGVARASRDGAWRVALAASQQPIDFVRILPFVGPIAPEDEEAAQTAAAAPVAAAPQRAMAAPRPRPAVPPEAAPAPAPAPQAEPAPAPPPTDPE